MDYVAFLLVNAVLFLRPQELVTELDRVPIYYFVILACLGFSFIKLVQLIFYSPLIWHPTVILSIVMVGLAAISLAVNNDLGEAIENEIEFLKILVYFLLFLAVVTTPARLRGVIACVVICMTVTAVAAILHYYGIIQIAILKIQETIIENPNGTDVAIRRLRFTGILHDPNEVGVFLSMLGFLCLYQLTDAKAGAARFLWLIPIGVFLYSLALTSSRGGLLSMMVGVCVFAVYKFRAQKAIFFLMLVIPLIFIAFAGRQTTISAGEETAQTRFGLWEDWFEEFRYHPFFGVGPKIVSDSSKGGGPQNWMGEKHVAHNSYLQPFADLGFLGGLCFLGAIGFAMVTVHRYGFNKTIILDDELSRMQPYLMGALACYAMGFLTLTLNYVIPTFFVLVLPVAYYGMTPCVPPVRRPTLSVDSLIRLGAAGVGFLAFTYVMIRIMPNK